MKLRHLILAASAALSLATTPANAQDPAWQKSYQLEAAGKYTEAIAAIDAIPANGPDAELKLLRRGYLYYLPGNFSESIREYRLAIERNGKSVDARLGLLLPLLGQQRWREAEQNARAALELVPNNYTALLRLIIALEGQRDWDRMQKAAASLVTAYPTDATAYIYLGRAQAWLNHRAEAVAAYNAVLVRSPGHLEAIAYIDKK